MNIHNTGELIEYMDFETFIDLRINNLEKIKKQYLNLLNELTACPDISNDLFYGKIKQISYVGKIIIAFKNINSDINTEIENFEIIGSGTIIIEPKIIRSGMSIGHIEDIVVKSTYRGKKIAQNILNKLKEFAKTNCCYKVILDCDESVCPVYRANGFEAKGIQMSVYF